MGVWGYKAFENDDAADWLYDLKESDDLAVIEHALTLDDDYNEAPEGCNALAAAEVLLALVGKPRPELPDIAASWVAGNRNLNGARLLPLAISAITNVSSDNSELMELWLETEDFDAWKEDVGEIISALKMANI